MLGYSLDFEPADRALDFIPHPAPTDPGTALGRQLHLRHLVGDARARRDRRDPRHEFVQRAVRWLIRHQNADGGWGETCESYARPSWPAAGVDAEPDRVGAAGALRGGHDLGSGRTSGIDYLLRTSAGRGVGDPLWNGTGFRESSTSSTTSTRYFPLWALGVYRRAHA